MMTKLYNTLILDHNCEYNDIQIFDDYNFPNIYLIGNKILYDITTNKEIYTFPSEIYNINFDK